MNHESRLRFLLLRFRHLIILLAYLALTLGLTYPLVAQFFDHVPGTATWSLDEYTLLWNNWWFKHAVFDLNVNPLHTDYLYYPLGTSLVFYMYTLFHVVIGLPIQFWLGIPAASNSELLFAFVMCGYGAFLLIRYLLRRSSFEFRDLAAFAGGAVFAFSANRFVYASLGHYNMVGMEWVPFFVLFFIKTVQEDKWTNAGLAGLFLAFALYLEMTYGVLLMLFALVYLALAWRHVLNRATIARLGVLAATALLLFLPLLIPTLGEIFNSGYTLPGWGHSEKLLVDLFGFFTPTSLQPLNRHWTQELDWVRQGISRFADINTVFLGYVTSALALLAAVRYWKTLKVWAISVIVFAVLSLGPLLHINGKSVFDLDGLAVTFPLPFLLLHYLPIVKENRAPNRFSVLIMLALAVLVAFAIAWISQKLKVKSPKVALLLPFAFLLLILFEHSAVPLSLTDARVPEVYAQIAREPGNSTVLTLPLGWRNSFGALGAEDTRVQYYQSVHQKYIFPGNSNRNPPFEFEYFQRVPIFHSLTEIEMYNPVSEEDLARDRAIAPWLATFFDLRYVVVNPAVPGRPPYSDTRDAVIDYVRAVLPLGEKIYDRDGVIAYRVNQIQLPARQPIQFGTDAAHIYQAEGWDRDERIAGESANWANLREARVMFPVREIGDYQIALRALPYTYAQAPAQTVELTVNDQSIQKFNLKSGWENYAATIPATALRSGLNDLVLKFGYAVKPRDVLPANYAIGATGVASPVDIVVNSGTLGSIQVNGREVSTLGPGYNVVVLDAKNGDVIASRLFNTADDKAQSRAMTDFLSQVRDGDLVLVAAQENAGANLGERTVAGLRSIGAQIDLRATPNRAHAIIGVKGATPGSAMEQASDSGAFIAVGHDPDSRTLAAAVSQITIEKR